MDIKCNTNSTSSVTFDSVDTNCTISTTNTTLNDNLTITYDYLDNSGAYTGNNFIGYNISNYDKTDESDETTLSIEILSPEEDDMIEALRSAIPSIDYKNKTLSLQFSFEDGDKMAYIKRNIKNSNPLISIIVSENLKIRFENLKFLSLNDVQFDGESILMEYNIDFSDLHFITDNQKDTECPCEECGCGKNDSNSPFDSLMEI
jgi:hypothetical protein